MSIAHALNGHKRRTGITASGTLPLRPCTVRQQECADPWDTTGQSSWPEWFAYDAFTGERVARSLYRNTLDELIAGRGYYKVTTEAAALTEPRIAFAPRPTQTPLRYYLADVIVCGTERLVCKAAREFHADTMLVEGANAAHVLMLMGEHYPGAIRMAPNAAGEWGAV